MKTMFEDTPTRDEELAHARALLTKHHLRQYEVKRICLILGYNDQQAVRELTYVNTRKGYAYETSEFEAWMKQQNNN